MHKKITFPLLFRRKKTLIMPVSAVFLGAALCSAPALSQDIQMQTNDMAKITVYASGTASAKPDMALLDLSVSHEAETAKAAMDQTSNTMTKVIAAMKAAGIKENDMQTVGLTVQPVYQSDNSTPRQPDKKEYQATNMLHLKVYDLARLGQIVDDAMTSGANGLGQMTLTNANPQPLYDEARKNAVTNAIAKARILADTAGVTLGRTWRIEEKSSVMEPMMARMAKSVMPIATGENSYDINVSLTMELINKK